MAEPAFRADHVPVPTPDRLAAFAAWLTGRVEDADTRRRYRAVVRAYLQFVADDQGAVGTRGCLFVVAHRGIELPETSRAAVEWLAEFDADARNSRTDTPASR